MRPLAQWSVLRVVLVCVSWVVLSVVVPMVWLEIQLRSEMASLSGTGGGVVGAVSVGVDALVVILPPALFCLAWLIARRRRDDPTPK